MKAPILAPSLLSADFADIGAGLSLIASSGAEWVHLDVMDGRFVPPITFGAKMVSDVAKRIDLPLDVHLMTVEPERLAQSFVEAGATFVTFHVETCAHANRLVESLRAAGARPGISLVPSTPLALLEELLPLVDLVLVMTVNPGFGGQSLIPSCLSKVERLVAMREANGLDFLISVDGGVNGSTYRDVARAGADVLVIGKAFFGAADPAAELSAARAAYAAEPRPRARRRD
jgi:ribulose-phosphate 3-epimerase